MPFFEKNDRVAISISKESRDWGYNPAPDGALGTIVGFSTIEYGYVHNFGIPPGTYLNKSWPIVRLDSGSEEITISSCHIKHAQDGLMEARRDAYWKLTDEERDSLRSQERVGDLPESNFWPGDVVRCLDGRKHNHNHPEDGSLFVVSNIDYHSLGKRYEDGRPMAAYSISSSLGAGWYMFANDDELTLIERGNVWKYYHGEPLKFSSLEDEARFFQMLGHTTEVRNPSNGLYSWTLEEALAAIRNGTAHAISVGVGLFGSAPHTSVARYKNAELGARVAELTLKGFNQGE